MAALKEKLKGINKKSMIIIISIIILILGSVLFMKVKATLETNNVISPMSGGTRTTILRKTTLDDSVSVSGTVQSQTTVNVTTTLTNKVSEIYVQVGDYVNEGDIIAKLDTTDITKQINNIKDKLADTKASAQTSYDTALANYNSSYDTAIAYENTLNQAANNKTNAYNSYKTALDSVSSLQYTYDVSYADMQNKSIDMNNALTAQINATNEYLQDSTNLEKEQAMNNAILYYEQTKQLYDTAKSKCDSDLDVLNTAKIACNLNALESAYNQAESTYNNTRTSLNNAQSTYEKAKETLENAKTALENASTNDELEDLYQKLEDCTIKATQSGTITALNATVGAASNGTFAIIEDTAKLKISTTFKEYDVQNIKLGMKCNITTDATGDTVISGYVSQISPTASSGGSSDVSFSAEITIDGTDHNLLIGMNAMADVIITQLSDIFVVPYDAVGTENSKTVVYVQQNDVFVPIEVTVGMETDYYAQISSPELTEGMVVRSSANEDESEIVNITDGTMDNMMGSINMGSAMGSAGAVMPSGGSMPSGGARPDRG